MADPNVNIPNVGAGATGGSPPAVLDPYQALVADLLLPADIARVLEAAFARLGCQMKKDEQSVKDYGQTPLPHYRIEFGARVLVFLHVGASVTANPYGQPNLIPIVFPFLPQASHLILVSEVEALAFSPDDFIGTLRSTKPSLFIEFVTTPLIQDFLMEPDDDARAHALKEALSLHELLALAAPQALDDLLETAYRECRPDLLDGVSVLPDRLTADDLNTIAAFIGPLALARVPPDVKAYYLSFLQQLGLDFEMVSFILPTLTGNPLNDARAVLMYLDEKTYLNGSAPAPGYNKILGYLLRQLADQGGGRQMGLLIFKYRLVTNLDCLKALVSKYP